MPNYTKNLGLTKPLPEEFYDVNVRNENWDKIDEAVGSKVGWSYEGIVGSGSIKDWALAQTTPITVSVSPDVTDMPYDNNYWLVTLEIAASGYWRFITAKDTDGFLKYSIRYINGVWTEWDSSIQSSGGVMNGRLWFGNGTHNGYGAIASNQTELHLAVFADPENSNSPYTNLVINNGEDVPDGQRLRVSIDSMNGDTSLRSYFLIHSGNINDYITSAGLTPASIE